MALATQVRIHKVKEDEFRRIKKEKKKCSCIRKTAETKMPAAQDCFCDTAAHTLCVQLCNFTFLIFIIGTTESLFIHTQRGHGVI